MEWTISVPQMTCWLVEPTSGTVVVGDRHGRVTIFDGRTGQAGSTLEGASQPVSCLAMGTTGSTIVSGHDTEVRVWQRGTCSAIHVHPGTVTAMAVSPDGSRVLTGSGEHTVRLWDLRTFQRLGEGRNPHPVPAQSEYLREFRDADYDNMGWILKKAAETAAQFVRGVSFGSEDRALSYSHHPKCARLSLWRVNPTMSLLSRPAFELRNNSLIGSYRAWLASSGRHVFIKADGRLTLWDFTTDRQLADVPLPFPTIKKIDFMPPSLAVACHTGDFYRVDLRTGKAAQIPGTAYDLQQLQVLEGGQAFVYEDEGRLVKVRL